MNISQLASGWLFRCSSPPLIPLMGEDNFIPVASPWLISPDCEAAGRQTGCFPGLVSGGFMPGRCEQDTWLWRNTQGQLGAGGAAWAKKWTKIPSCQGAAVYCRENIQGSTINTKPSELDYQRAGGCERQAERKWEEVARKVADGCITECVHTEQHRRKERRAQWKRQTLLLLHNLQIQSSLTSQSQTHKTLTAVENEQISNTFSTIHRCTFERGDYFDTAKQARINTITATLLIFYFDHLTLAWRPNNKLTNRQETFCW